VGIDRASKTTSEDRSVSHDAAKRAKIEELEAKIAQSSLTEELSDLRRMHALDLEALRRTAPKSLATYGREMLDLDLDFYRDELDLPLWSEEDLRDVAVSTALFLADVTRQIAREARAAGLPSDTLGLDPQLLEALAEEDSNIVVIDFGRRELQVPEPIETLVSTLTRSSNAPGAVA
jgi:hypothetical protein